MNSALGLVIVLLAFIGVWYITEDKSEVAVSLLISIAVLALIPLATEGWSWFKKKK